MAEFAEQARIFLEQIIAQLGYGGIVLATMLETIFPPLPSDLIVPAAGLLAARGEMHVAAPSKPEQEAIRAKIRARKIELGMA